jgi:hypothetical protein
MKEIIVISGKGGTGRQPSSGHSRSCQGMPLWPIVTLTQRIFESRRSDLASLYFIKGKKNGKTRDGFSAVGVL